MSKDAYWFKHDSNASRDIKLMKLKHIHDFWGLGLYWSVIELLREQPDYQFNSDESSLQLACSLVSCSDFNRFKSWFFDAVKFELFVIQENVFFSESLCKRMGKWETKKTNGSKGGRPPKTESGTELKPKSKAKRNHKIIKDKIIKDIIDYFNSVTGKNFSYNTKETIKLLSGRLNKFTTEDCKKVIDIKNRQWKGNKDMEKYLCPSTLFSESNFEKYLNESPINKPIAINKYTEEQIRKAKNYWTMDRILPDYFDKNDIHILQ